MPELRRSGRFTLILAAIAISAIAGMSAVLLWQLRGQELRHAESEAISLSHIIAEQTTRSFQGIDLALDIVLERLEQAATTGIDIDDVAVARTAPKTSATKSRAVVRPKEVLPREITVNRRMTEGRTD